MLTIGTITTVDQANDAIRAAIASPRGPRPADVRSRAAVLADLHELRAGLWDDLARAAYGNDLIPNAYANAAALAGVHDTDRARFFRREAGAR